MVEASISLGVLLVFTFVWILLAYRNGEQLEKRGMALPRGSIRALIAIWVIGSFIIFVFFGREALRSVADDGSGDLFEKVLASFTTLVGAISGFYFGGRTGQTLSNPQAPTPPDAPGPAEAVGESDLGGGFPDSPQV